MTLPEMNIFNRLDVFPSWFANSIEKALSGISFNLSVTKQSATVIQVIAGAAQEAAIVAIQGKWRWVEATITRTHPGGAAGTYDIFAVAAGNKIDVTPAPGTDNTNYAFELRILKAGETPPIVAGVLDVFRKIGSCQWSGTEITRVDQIVPMPATHALRHAVGQPDALKQMRVISGAATAVGGDTIIQTVSGTITLTPTPSLGDEITLFAGAAATMTVTSAALKIYGKLLNAALTFTLLPLSAARLVYDGSEWLLTTGEPKPEAGYSLPVERAVSTEFEPSASRSTFVSLEAVASCATGQTMTVIITVGGVPIAQYQNVWGSGSGTMRWTYGFPVPPGVKWFATVTGTASGQKLFSSYLPQ